MASFRIPNEYKEEFIVQWEALGIEQLDINFYDRGYSKAKSRNGKHEEIVLNDDYLWGCSSYFCFDSI